MFKEVVLMTGATGFIGCHMAVKLLQSGCQIFALARPKNGIPPRERLVEAITNVDPSLEITDQNLIVIPGSINDNVDDWITEIRKHVQRKIDSVWHFVAIFKIFKKAKEEVKSVNIEGVRGILEFVRRVNGNIADCPRYFHVSTAYSNGKCSDAIDEKIRVSQPEFRSLYDWSKHGGECMVRQYQKKYNLDVSIFRPSIVVSSPGSKVVNYAAYYQILEVMYSIRKRVEVSVGKNFDGNIGLRVWCDPNVRMNIVPVDFVVEAMRKIASRPQLKSNELKIYNIVNEEPPSINLILDTLCESLNIMGVSFVERKVFDKEPMSTMERLFDRKIVFQAPYTREINTFNCDKFRGLVSYDEVPIPTIDADFLRDINKNFLEVHESNLNRKRVRKIDKNTKGNKVKTLESKPQKTVVERSNRTDSTDPEEPQTLWRFPYQHSNRPVLPDIFKNKNYKI